MRNAIKTQLAIDTQEANQKIHLINAWLENNASHGPRAMVDKFKLAWSHEKDLGNGIAIVGFYTDESMRFEVCRMHLASAGWFRA